MGEGLDTALLAGTAAIVRDGRNILNGGDFQADGLEGADSRLATGARALHSDLDFAHTVRHCLARGVLSDLLGGVGSALARALESNAPGARPPDDMALH